MSAFIQTIRTASAWLIENTSVKQTEKRISGLFSIALRLLGLVLAIFAGLLIWRLIKDDGFVLEPFSVPKSIEVDGFDGIYIARHIQDNLHALKQEAKSTKADSLQVGGSTAPDLNVKMMGVEFSLGTIAHQLRVLMGRPVRSIRGEVVETSGKINMTLRMSGYPPINIAAPFSSGHEADAVENLCRSAAEAIIGANDPYRLAVLHYRRKEYDVALDLVRRVIRDRPHERTWGYLAWGNILKEQGNLDMAISKFQRATELDSTFALAWRAWGTCLQKKNDLPAALNKMERAARYQSTDPNAWLTLGWLYLNGGKSAESNAAFAKALQIAPNVPEVLASCAQAKQQQKDSLQAAIQLLERSIELSGETAHGYLSRMLRAIMMKDTLAALNYALYSAELDPTNPYGASMGMQLAFYTRNYPKTIEISRAANFSRMSKQEAIGLYNYLAMAYNFTAQHDSAFAVIRRGIALDTTMSVPYTTLAETYAFVGNNAAFYKNLEKAFLLGLNSRFIDSSTEPYRRFIQVPRYQALMEKYAK